MRCLGEQIFNSKQFLRAERHLLAHPIISDAQLKAFLKDLGNGGRELSSMEIAVFDHLKATRTAITKANIEASRPLSILGQVPIYSGAEILEYPLHI